MKSNQNLIDIIITPEQRQVILAALAQLEAAFTFATPLAPRERQGMVKLGQRSEGFVRDALVAARENGDYVPTVIKLDALERDAAVREFMHGVTLRLIQLSGLARDTHTVAGSDLMKGAMDIYRALKANGHGAGLDDTFERLEPRFRRARRKSTAPREESEA